MGISFDINASNAAFSPPNCDGSFEPDPTHTYKVANSSVTQRGGFGSTYAPWIIGGAGLLLLWNVGS